MKKFILGAIVLVGGLFLLERIFGQNTQQRSFLYFDDMYQSVAYKAQSANPHLRDGLTHQPPAPGTIPRGYLPLHFGTSEVELLRARDELINPYAADSTANPVRGAEIYRIYCQVCHGAGGAGDGTVTQRGYPPPPSLSAAQTVNRTDGELFHILTYGYKNMPQYATQVDREDRWHVINHIRTMQVITPE